MASSNDSLTDVVYDDHGNTTQLGDSSHETGFEYDASDRNIAITSGNKETTYTRDASDRITAREVQVNSSQTSYVEYGFGDESDAPIVLRDGGGTIIQQYVSLPGDVLVTIKPQSTSAGIVTHSLPNIHGDVFATVNADGMLTGRFLTGPFGEPLPITPSGITNTNPINSADGTSNNYVGQHQKITDDEATAIEGGIIQMGARVYIPILGRFITVDPYEGGTDNSYVYVNDSVNSQDTSGKGFWFVAAWIVARMVVQAAAKKAAQEAAKKIAINAARELAKKKTAQAAAQKAAQEANRAIARKIARNLSEQLILEAVLANPTIGREIMKGKIDDDNFKRSNGWRKMHFSKRLYGGRVVVVHYFYNVWSKSIKQLKIK